MKKYYKVEACKDLFEQAANISVQSQYIACIVQNDMIVTDTNVEEFKQNVTRIVGLLEDWKNKVLNYLEENELTEAQAQQYHQELRERYGM